MHQELVGCMRAPHTCGPRFGGVLLLLLHLLAAAAAAAARTTEWIEQPEKVGGGRDDVAEAAAVALCRHRRDKLVEVDLSTPALDKQ